MSDKYRNFKELAAAEVFGQDYRIHLRLRGNDDVAIVAPHGGSIERRTSEIAQALAGDRYNLYLFEGLDPDGSFDNLHITSHRFDEPCCLNLIRTVLTVVTIHGCSGDEKQIFLGGLNYELKEKIAAKLQNADIDVNQNDHQFQGEHQNNICNRGRSGAGVQIELSDALRGAPEEIHAIDAIRTALIELDLYAT